MLITRCWNIIQSGAWRHLRHARRLRSSDMVITAICVHLMLSVFQLQSSRLLGCTKLCRWREEQYKYIWWFQILDGKKKPSIYFGLCLVCVNGSRVLSNVEGGMGWQQILDTKIQNQAKYILCHLFVNTIGKNSSLNARDSSF